MPCSVTYNKARRAKLKEVKPLPVFKRSLDSKRYIITSAQNGTDVHEGFLKTLKFAAKHLDAELVVIPYRYKNPTRKDEVKDDEWWADELRPYLFNQRKKLGPNLTLCADVQIQATASTPLTGFESLTGPESCIIGHPKMQFKTVPVPSGRFPKILSTTGACTERHYSKTKAGAIGKFHHFLGAVIVELSGKRFHIRQINADRRDGSFTDLDKHFTEFGYVDAPAALALVIGDTHVRVTDPAVDAATFGPGGMVEVLNPQTLVFHDILDGETVNPHDAHDPFIAEAKRKASRQDVLEEIKEVADFVNARAGDREVVIVASNHHDFVRRWAVNTDARDAGLNMVFLLETQLYMAKSAVMKPNGASYADPFTYWLRQCGAKARCLEPDESFRVAGNECGMHGHWGPSGARGSVKNLSRLGTKVVSAHGHAPEICEGHYRVGTSTPRRQAYQHGASATLQTHCVIYATGARCLLTIVEDEWRGVA